MLRLFRTFVESRIRCDEQTRLAGDLLRVLRGGDALAWHKGRGSSISVDNGAEARWIQANGGPEGVARRIIDRASDGARQILDGRPLSFSADESDFAGLKNVGGLELGFAVPVLATPAMAAAFCGNAELARALLQEESEHRPIRADQALCGRSIRRFCRMHGIEPPERVGPVSMAVLSGSDGCVSACMDAVPLLDPAEARFALIACPELSREIDARLQDQSIRRASVPAAACPALRGARL